MNDDEDVAALNAALAGMFKALEMRPLPDRILSVVDQLDEGDPPEPLKAQGRG